ncbi:MAG: 30S ribosomal protein S6 [Candidatus Caldatribacteriaceae bacterium]
MQEYELGVVIRPTLAEEGVQNVVEKLKNVIVGQGGTVEKVDLWGKRRLAYPIEKYTEGYYVFLHFVLPPKNVTEVSRVARYTEDVLRHILVKEEEKRAVEERVPVPERRTGGTEALEPEVNEDVSTQPE